MKGLQTSAGTWFPKTPLWLNGKYSWYENGNKIEAEINTRLPFVSLGDYFVQGEGADTIIEEIHHIWVSDGRRTTKSAVKHWMNLML